MINEVDKENIKTAVISEEISFFRYAIVVEYIGTSYSGSQIQLNVTTVQSVLERTLERLVNNPVKTRFSGRTDAGVHSKGQVVHFDIPKRVDENRFICSLNALLPTDISVSAIAEVDKAFHSQKNALCRWYRYKINNESQRSAWSREVLYVKQKLDVDAMNTALSYLEGEHDFSSFKSVSTTNPATECILYSAKCKKQDGSIDIDIVGNRFLYNMIRIIVGTLLPIGKGTLPPTSMLDVLKHKNRAKAGITASPEGLMLMYVGYSKKYNLFDCVNKEANKDEDIFSKAS